MQGEKMTEMLRNQSGEMETFAGFTVSPAPVTLRAVAKADT